MHALSIHMECFPFLTRNRGEVGGGREQSGGGNERLGGEDGGKLCFLCIINK